MALGALGSVSVTPEEGEDSPSGASLRGSHRLAAIDACERMWALRYFWFFRPLTDNPWRLGGTLVHTCREYYFASLMPPHMQPEWFRTKDLTTRLKEQSGGRDDLVQMALNNLVHYMQWATDDRHHLQVIGIEKEYTATVGELDPGGPWPELDDEIVSCRTDLVYQNTAGVWVMDYKSHGRSKVNKKTGRLTKWDWAQGEYALNWQILQNMHILRKRLGAAAVRGFVIERTTRQEPWDHDRHVVNIPKMAYEDTPRVIRIRVKQERDLIARLQSGGRPTPAYHACMGRFGPCDYRDACLAKDKNQMYERLLENFARPSEKEITKMHSRLRVVQ